MCQGVCMFVCMCVSVYDKASTLNSEEPYKSQFSPSIEWVASLAGRHSYPKNPPRTFFISKTAKKQFNNAKGEK